MQTRTGLIYGETFQKVDNLEPPVSKLELDVVIDFDEASTAWKLNKKSIGNGCYKYVCVKIKKTGSQCKNDSMKNCEFCRLHCSKLSNKKFNSTTTVVSEALLQ